MRELEDEFYLFTRLKLLGLTGTTFDGSDSEQRREKMRSAIKDFHLEENECWRIQGEPQTYAQAFAAVYGESP